MFEILGVVKAVIQRNRGRIVVAVVLVVGLYFVVAFGEQAWKARTLQAEVDQRQAVIATMQAKHDALQQQLAQYQSPQYDDYAERIARRDLNLARPGETVIMVHVKSVPTPALTPTAKSSAAPAQKHQANWQGWLELFGLH